MMFKEIADKDKKPVGAMSKVQDRGGFGESRMFRCPGTVLNGSDSWEDYKTRIKATAPAIPALGVTDYYRVDTDERVPDAKLGSDRHQF